MRKLTVRNVSQRSLKFKYELPSTKFFSTAFPTVMTLSSGMQTVLDVTFRPVRLEEYDDYVGFHVHVIEGGVTATSGRFRIPVTARIATLSVSLPRGLDFGFCPTRELTHKTFQLWNTGQLDALFEWKLAGEHLHQSLHGSIMTTARPLLDCGVCGRSGESRPALRDRARSGPSARRRDDGPDGQLQPDHCRRIRHDHRLQRPGKCAWRIAISR